MAEAAVYDRSLPTAFHYHQRFVWYRMILFPLSHYEINQLSCRLIFHRVAALEPLFSIFRSLARLEHLADLPPDPAHLLGHIKGDGNLLSCPAGNLSASLNGNHLNLLLSNLGYLPDFSLGHECGAGLGEANHKCFIQGSHRSASHYVVDIVPLLIRDHGEVLDIVLPCLASPLQDASLSPDQSVLLHLRDYSLQLLHRQVPERISSGDDLMDSLEAYIAKIDLQSHYLIGQDIRRLLMDLDLLQLRVCRPPGDGAGLSHIVGTGCDYASR